MMNLDYLGIPIDTSVEHEFITGNLNGFTVTIHYNPTGAYKHLGSETIRNITEVHHLFESHVPRIAFESDIHNTGFNRDIKDIHRVVIGYSEMRYTMLRA